MKKYVAVVLIMSFSILSLVSCNDGNGQPVSDYIVNGNFETGDLTGWTASGINDGCAFVVEEGTCFSANNTLGIAMKGIFSANVRTCGSSPLNSIGILTSDPFIAGNTIRFIALSENDDDIPAPNPVTLDVLVLDDADAVLFFDIVDTNVVTLSRSNFDGTCIIGDIRDGAFSTHIIDTSDFAGEVIRIQFRQSTNVAGSGFFTLIDEVEVIE